MGSTGDISVNFFKISEDKNPVLQETVPLPKAAYYS